MDLNISESEVSSNKLPETLNEFLRWNANTYGVSVKVPKS